VVGTEFRNGLNWSFGRTIVRSYVYSNWFLMDANDDFRMVAAIVRRWSVVELVPNLRFPGPAIRLFTFTRAGIRMLHVRSKNVALNNPVYWLKLLQWTTTSGTTAQRKTAY
jgi:hypothetical protein